MKHLHILLVAALCAVSAAGCDKPQPDPEVIAQEAKAREGIVWRDLLRSLEAAADDAARIQMLERFVADHPSHPDLADAKRRLDELRADPAAASRLLVTEAAQRATSEGKMPDVLAMLGSESVRLASTRHERDPLGGMVEVPTTSGVKQMEKSLFLHPLVLRGHVRSALRAHVADVPERCDRACVNETVNALLQKSAGGPIFLEDGKMNPDAVGPLLEKAWLAPGETLLGAPTTAWYVLYAPTFQAYALIGHIMKAGDPKAAGEKLATLTTPADVAAYYVAYADEHGLAEKTGLDAKDARAIAGWWLRRYADGTAPLFDAFVVKVREAYNPELTLP